MEELELLELPSIKALNRSLNTVVLIGKEISIQGALIWQIGKEACVVCFGIRFDGVFIPPHRLFQ